RLDGLVGGITENMASITGIPGLRDIRLPQILTRGKGTPSPPRAPQAPPIIDLLQTGRQTPLDLDAEALAPAAEPDHALDAVLHRFECGFIVRGRRLAQAYAPGLAARLDTQEEGDITLLR